MGGVVGQQDRRFLLRFYFTVFCPGLWPLRLIRLGLLTASREADVLGMLDIPRLNSRLPGGGLSSGVVERQGGSWAFSSIIVQKRRYGQRAFEEAVLTQY